VDSKKSQGGQILYKVKWKGYGAHKITWEPLTNLENAKDTVQDFHRKAPHKPKPTTICKIKIPISQFPKELLCPIAFPITNPILQNIPSENILAKFAQNGVHALERG
jgi:Chromo (CHRromatin Organisation MOdifier) domain